MTGLPDQSQRAAFLSTAQGKLISALVVVALVFGIVAEGITIYRQGLGAMIDRQTLEKLKAETAIAQSQLTGIARPLTTPDAEKADPATDAGLEAFLKWKRINRAREAQGLPKLTQQEFEAQQAVKP